MNKKTNDTFSFTTAPKFVHCLVGADIITRKGIGAREFLRTAATLTTSHYYQVNINNMNHSCMTPNKQTSTGL